MRTFTRFRSCPKCGSLGYSTSYEQHKDLLKLTCTQCGYVERQLPQDRIEENA